MPSKRTRGDLESFVDLLEELRGVLELKLVRGDQQAWIGLRLGRQRPPHVLLQQISRAADGFGIDTSSVHFGILAD
ncbi:MAG: hypothetical protein R6V85_19050 [Polyangia bacterium]